MKKNVANFCKSMSIIIGIISILAKLNILFFTNEWNVYEADSIVVTLLLILSMVAQSLLPTILLCLLLYGVGEVIELVASLKETVCRTQEKLEAGENASNSRLDLLSIQKNTEKEQWTCSKCGAENQRSQQYCKECGQYKKSYK